MPDLSLFDLTGKKALVTGAGIGIGRGCAEALAMAGADVAIIDINMDTAEWTASEIRAKGRQAIAVRCDVSDEAQVGAMIAEVTGVFGNLDIAVNNAGISRAVRDIEQTKANWDKVISVNLTGVWLCARAEARQMRSQNPAGGKIINTASMAATIVSDGDGSYNAAKAGVVHLTHTLAAQWGSHNINVNCFSPSYTMTPNESYNSPEEVRNNIRNLTPLGHVQRPADLYGPIIFLASRASDYVTGQDLMVDGGHTLNAWLGPLSREVAPRITPDEEVAAMKRDISAVSSARANSKL